ncbi:MAG: response regulator [Bacteroidetes bacterium]|nr:response regulator [Bacteroidota bacterium]
MEIKEIIYLVEDNKAFGLLTQKKLEKEFGCQVKHFGTGEEMLEFLDNNPDQQPGIIILDYYLNSMVETARNGEEILEELKLRKKNNKIPRKLPIIMLTAANELKMAVNLLQAGAVDYILKDDVFIENLSKTIHNIRNLRNYEAEIESHKAKAKAYRKRIIIMGTVIVVLLVSLVVFILTK